MHESAVGYKYLKYGGKEELSQPRRLNIAVPQRLIGLSYKGLRIIYGTSIGIKICCTLILYFNLHLIFFITVDTAFFSFLFKSVKTALFEQHSLPTCGMGLYWVLFVGNYFIKDVGKEKKRFQIFKRKFQSSSLLFLHITFICCFPRTPTILYH